MSSSSPFRHDDPFAPREGKTLLWTNVNMRLRAKGKRPARHLLENVWGEVPSKEITAIMGPSGAGKTSLLYVLAGRYKSAVANNGSSKSKTNAGHGLLIESDIRVNNYRVNPSNINIRKHIAFVAQDDSLQVTSTPRESIYFSAKLRLPRSTSENQLNKLVEKMLAELGLTHCADTIVGGALLKGISGGERKRTSVGLELVVRPTMVFLDEPTSGLDSYSAEQLCQVLKKVANAGASVLFTIHQPASEIFNMFDHLILLNKGRVMYQGSVHDVPNYFNERHKPLPEHYNPADWIMRVAQQTPLKELIELEFFQDDTRNLPDPYINSTDEDPLRLSTSNNDISRHLISEGYSSRDITPHDTKKKSTRPVGLGTQIKMLFQRELQFLARDKSALGARLGISSTLALLFGLIFFDVGSKDPYDPINLSSHFGALVMCMISSMFGPAQAALLQFPLERPVFIREYSTNHYSVVSYFISRLSVEASVTAIQILFQTLLSYFMINFKARFYIYFALAYSLAMTSTAVAVMLGSLFKDPKIAQEMLPLVFVPQLLFAGFFTAPDLIPVWLRWARWVCSLTYAISIIVVEEFYYGYDCMCEPCENLIERLDSHPDNVWWYSLVLIGLFLGFRTGALINLRRKATQFF